MTRSGSTLKSGSGESISPRQIVLSVQLIGSRLLEAWISTAYGPYTRIRPNERGSVDLVTATTLQRGKLERIIGVEDVCLNLKGDGNVERLGFDEDFLDYSHRDIPKATVGPIRLVKVSHLLHRSALIFSSGARHAPTRSGSRAPPTRACSSPTGLTYNGSR